MLPFLEVRLCSQEVHVATRESRTNPPRGSLPSPRAENRWKSAWNAFAAALPLFLCWISAAFLFILIIFGLNEMQPLIRGVYRPPLSTLITVDNRQVRISYPQQITTDSSLLSQQAIVMQAVGAGNDPRDSLVVEIRALDDLAFLDEEGHLLPQPLRLRVSADPKGIPSRFYLLPAARRGQVRLEVVAIGETGTTSRQITIALEPPLQTWLFRIIGGLATSGLVAGALLSAVAGFAVQQWSRMTEEESRKERERQDALREIGDLRELLQQQEYERALTRYQALRARQRFPWCEDAIRAVLEETWREEAPWELQKWDRLCRTGAGDEETDAQDQRGKGPERIVRAILWAFRNLPNESVNAPRILSEQLRRDAYIAFDMEHLLPDDADGRALLRSEELEQALREKGEKETCSKLRECMQRLQMSQPVPWFPRPSAVTPPDPPAVARGIRALGLRCNPFGPERAELDSHLHEYGYRGTLFWEEVTGAKPVLALGGPGSGKTATALLLAYDAQFPPSRPREEKVFPVYLTPRESPFPSSREVSRRYLLDQVARGVADALLQVIAVAPYSFTAQDPARQAAIACLWVAYLGKGSVENLNSHLWRVGLQEKGAGGIVRQKVQKFATGTTAALDESTLIGILGEARPADLQRTDILMDWGAEPDAARAIAIARSLEAFLEVVPALAARGVYVKAFLPRTCRPSMREDLVSIVELYWRTEDLLEMLQARLTYAGLNSLKEVYSDPAGIQPDPEVYLAEHARGSPRMLVRLGNRMLAHVEKPPLTREHLL